MPQSPQQRPLDALSKMKIALADAVTKWAELEDALALLLSEALGSEQRLGPLIYFAPVATKTRLAIVDAVLPLYLKSDPRFWQFCPIWTRLLGKLNTARRNSKPSCPRRSHHCWRSWPKYRQADRPPIPSRKPTREEPTSGHVIARR